MKHTKKDAKKKGIWLMHWPKRFDHLGRGIDESHECLNMTDASIKAQGILRASPKVVRLFVEQTYSTTWFEIRDGVFTHSTVPKRFDEDEPDAQPSWLV